jgi:NAD-dependent deacetylase
MHPRRIVVLTGAGISAESGLRTFRDAGGLWEGHRVEDVATPEGFRTDPERVHAFYNERRAQLASVQPNEAHLALARLEAQWPGDFLLVTQNVDDLHDRAGSVNLLHMHGELLKVRCMACRAVLGWTGGTGPGTPCPACGATRLRPHIVWFGEVPLHMDTIMEALEACDCFIAIGTSGQVYPAAGFFEAVPDRCRTVELNMELSAVSSRFRERRQGPAGLCVPRLVEELLDGLPKGRPSP